eukprot:2550441-Prymnesium_polylepis.2
MLQTKKPQVGDAAAFKPTLFLAAPAVLDRIYAAVNGKINAAPKPIKAWFKAALADGAANFDKGVIGVRAAARLRSATRAHFQTAGGVPELRRRARP